MCSNEPDLNLDTNIAYLTQAIAVWKAATTIQKLFFGQEFSTKKCIKVFSLISLEGS